MKTKLVATLLAFCGGAILLPAQETQLDQVLAELQKLNEGLRRVESRLDELESQMVSVSVEAVSVPAAAPSTAESGTFIDRVVEAVKDREERVNFPWMEKALWAQVEKGMSPEEVVGILGEPTLEDPSLNRLVDIVYTYRGRKPATGEKVVGKVKFRKDRVVEIEAP